MSRTPVALAVALALVTLALQLVWTLQNRGVVTLGDDLTLLSRGLTIHQALFQGGLVGALVPDPRAGTPYPPLLPLWTAVQATLWGPRLHLLLLGHGLWWAIALAAAWWVGRGSWGPWGGLAAVALVPLTLWQTGVSDHLFTELPMSALALASVAALSHSAGFTRRGASLALGLALSLGLLAKWSFAFFLGPPMLLAVALALVRPVGGHRGLVLRGLALVVLPLLVLALPWYAAAWPALVAFQQRNLAHDYDGVVLPLAQAWSLYPAWLGQLFLGAPLLVLLALGVVGALLARQPRGHAPRWAALGLLSGTVLLTLAPYRSHRYLVGGLGLLVPLMVGGLALVPATLRRTRRGGLVAGALLLACASLFHQQGWLKLPWNDALLARGATGEPRELRWGPWRCQWSQPAPQRLPPPERVLLAQVVDWTGDDGWALAAWNTGDDWRPVVAAGEALLFTGGRQVPSSRLDDAYLSYLQRLPLDMLLVVAPGGSGVEEALRAAFPALECSSLATFRAIMEREDHGVWDFTWDVPHSKGPIRALVLGQRPSLRLSLHRCPLHPSSILPPR